MSLEQPYTVTHKTAEQELYGAFLRNHKLGGARRTVALADFACEPCFGHVATICVRHSLPVALASSNSTDTTALSIYEQLIQVCSGTGDRLLTATQIKALLAERFGTNPASVLPSDFCYNRWNQGISQRKPLFVRVGTLLGSQESKISEK